MDLLRRERVTPRWDQGRRLALRVFLGLVLMMVLGTMAYVALFAGMVTITGCFMSCSDPNVPVGTALLLLAVALGAAALASMWWGLVDRHWPRAWRVIGVLTALGVIGVLATLAAVDLPLAGGTG